jgi:phage terminase large subunit-like protein
MLTQARALAARPRQFVNATTVKEVVHNGKRVGVLIMLGVDPKFAGNAVFQQQSVVGLAGELAGTSPKIAAQVFGAHKVTTAVAGGQVAAWYANKQIVLLLAQPNLAAAQGFLAVYPIPTGKNSTLG